MAAPYRSTVTIDGIPAFEAVSTSVSFSTLKDQSGMPVMGSLLTNVKVWVDFHDDKNLPNSSLKSLFGLANVVTNDKIKSIKVEFWKDDSHGDALCSYQFKGWVSKFETSNPLPDASPQTSSSNLTPYSTLNHMLYLELEPARNTSNFPDISMGN